MLFVYKTGAVRVTPKFTRFMTAALVGVLFAALGSILLSFFTGTNPLYNGGPLAIGFCLLCIGLAAFSFCSTSITPTASCAPAPRPRWRGVWPLV